MSRSKSDLIEEVKRLIEATRKEFGRINADKKQVTPADRERLKTLYVEHVFLPQVRLIMEKHFPNPAPQTQNEPSPTPETVEEELGSPVDTILIPS